MTVVVMLVAALFFGAPWWVMLTMLVGYYTIDTLQRNQDEEATSW